MSSINPREVLKYLNELGYRNITQEQLKSFMQDLKRLIKYESKDNAENISPGPCPTPTKPNRFTRPTESWVSKQKELFGNKVLLEINHPAPKYSPNCNSTASSNRNSTRNSVACSNSNYCGPNCVLYKTNTSSAPDILKIDESVHPPSRSKSWESLRKPKIPSAKYKRKTVILPRQPQKITKCDPVMLYHKYQEEWKKHNIPGEADHADLRWSIRQRLIGQPEPSLFSLEAISKKRSATPLCSCD